MDTVPPGAVGFGKEHFTAAHFDHIRICSADGELRVLVERETIYTEEVEMLMKGAPYTEVIEFMDREGDKRKDNPFERFSDAAPAAPQPGV